MVEHIKEVLIKSRSKKDLLFAKDNLTEEEKDIVRRGRNAENHHLPKNANVQEYMYATAYEALLGYLYLTKQTQRLQEILKISVD